jgi:hypothetical protein
MTDNELLEFAAKAAGIEIMFWSGREVGAESPVVKPHGITWNPLVNDGDALRLAVRLEIDIQFDFGEYDCVFAWYCIDQDRRDGVDQSINEPNTPDSCAATRRAITRAAAELGKAKP